MLRRGIALTNIGGVNWARNNKLSKIVLTNIRGGSISGVSVARCFTVGSGRSSLRGSSKIPGEDNASLMMKRVSAN